MSGLRDTVTSQVLVKIVGTFFLTECRKLTKAWKTSIHWNDMNNLDLVIT